MPQNRCIIGCLVFALGGCGSNITVTKLNPGGPPPYGVPWNLPMTQYTLTITRQIMSCDETMNAKISVSVAQGKTIDPSERYVLSSSGIWATSDISAGLAADGTSTSLNAHSEDQTATVITNVVTTAAQIAMAAASRGEGQPYFKCTPEVETARLKLKPSNPKEPSLADTVDADNALVVSAMARVTELTTEAQTDPSKKHVLSLADVDLARKTAKLTRDQAELTANLKIVQNVQTVVWPTSGDVVKSDHIFKLDETVAQKWINWFIDRPGRHPELVAHPLSSDQMSNFDVSLALYRPDGSGGWTTELRPPSPDIGVGVPVRVAGLGRLMVCTGSDACDSVLASNRTLKKNESLPIKPDATALQVGQMYIVPITGGKFKSETAAISMDTNGNPTSIEIAEKTAVAAAATGSLAAGVSQIAAIPGQVAAAKLARVQAESSQINAENALLQAQANAKTAGATADAIAQGALATANVNLATAQANAQNAGPVGQLALVNAQNNLAVAQAQAAANAHLPDDQDDLAVLNTRTTLLNAQANEINAETALAKAKAALAAVP